MRRALIAMATVLAFQPVSVEGQMSRDSVQTLSVKSPALDQTLKGASLGIVGAVAGAFAGAALQKESLLSAGIGAGIGEVAGVTLGVRMSTTDSRTSILADAALIAGIGAAGSAIIGHVPYGAAVTLVTLSIPLAQAAAASSLERTRGCCNTGTPSPSTISLHVLPFPGGIGLVASITR